MTKLEDITVGSSVKGIISNSTVTIVAVQWYGNNVLEITYKDSHGQPGNQMLLRDEEINLTVMDNSLPWSFDADGEQMKLASEAYRISLAHLFDPYLAVHTSSVEPLPHQISAVYQEMLPKLPLRYVLADDPGAGKTIMTGLFIKELIARGDLKRCLIVSPGSLVEQWQDELFSKFHLTFQILTNDRMESAVTGNVFNEVDFCICRLDKLARNEQLQEKLKVSEWDLIVCDEAHKMSATIWGGEVKYTKRFQLGKLLSNITKNFLLLTATPHNGKDEDFHLFLSLVDPDRFEGIHNTSEQTIDVSDVMRRLTKEELLKFDGTPLFPERIAYTVNYSLSPQEAQLYQAVTDYVQEEFNRADNLNNERKTTVGFALTILQRRLASSPEAIYQSLRRRRERLEHRLAEEKMGKRAADYTDAAYDIDDDDDLTPDEQEAVEEKVVDHASAAATIAELEIEIKTLKRLEKMANDVRVSGVDRKWDELSSLLQDNQAMYGEDNQREKLIIFTEHKDTLNYLAGKIRALLGDDEAVVTIHGGMLRDERRKTEQLFKQDVGVRILIATDAAGEGINLQRAHLMINYDLPWNPNRLEQRFGRIHRIGQTEVCHLWNLVANETREGYVFQRLFLKLEEERQALGGKVFDILGKVSFDNKSLRDLLIEAVRYGNDPEVRARLNRVVDKSLDPQIFRDIIRENALTDDVMDIHMVNAIREDMERVEAHKLQPHFIELNTLHGSLSYLYNNPNGNRFWYDTKPTLRKTAEDRASQVSLADVDMEIESRLKKCRKENPFAGVHPSPTSSGDVPDDQAVRLVLLRTNDTYRRNYDNSAAMRAVQDILNNRGASPRIFRNMLAFVAPDESKIGALRQEVKRYIAWTSIMSDKEDLNLDGQQVRETENNLKRSNDTVELRLKETYCWLMVPFIDQYGDMKAIQWEISDLGGGQDSIVAKAARKMLQSDQVITRWAPALLQMTLDELLWKDTENISVKKLWEYLCTYCYLPRLSSYSVLQETICQGCASDEYFGIAAAHNGERYVGLKWNQSIFNFNNTDLLVKPSAAKAQIKEEAEAQAAAGSQATSGGTSSGFTPSGSGMHTGTSSEGAGTPGGTGAATPPTAANRHFYMSADVDAVRVNRVISTYVDEIIRHLMQVEGANVQLKLEVEVNAPDGIPSSTVRTVSENCKTLKITDFGFDD